jgi:hypothetical protein
MRTVGRKIMFLRQSVAAQGERELIARLSCLQRVPLRSLLTAAVAMVAASPAWLAAADNMYYEYVNWAGYAG